MVMGISYPASRASSEAGHPAPDSGPAGALKILDGEVLHGDHVVIEVDKKKQQLTFKVAKRVGEPAAVQ